MSTDKRNRTSWKEWNAQSYLNTYYKNPVADTYETLSFIHRSLSGFIHQPFKRALEFGSGPALYGLLGLEPYVQEVHAADYLSNNLSEITKWIIKNPESFDWNSCIRMSLLIEGRKVSRQSISLRAENLRKKLTKVLKGNIKKKWPLLNYHGHYNLVASFFCADSITSSKEDWFKYMDNLFSLARPGGVILIGALRNCNEYRVGDRCFPSAYVNEKDIVEAVLRSKLRVKKINTEVKNVEECRDEGFTSVVFAKIVLK